jgi:hypothetical protein
MSEPAGGRPRGGPFVEESPMKFRMFLLGLVASAGTATASGIEGSGIIVLHPSMNGALTMSGNSTVQIPAKAVFVNSNHATAVRMSGNATLDAPNLNVVGGTSMSGNSQCTGSVALGSLPVQDPLSGLQFPSSAGMQNMGAQSLSSSTQKTLSPGYYPSISISANAVVTLQPGLYVLGGNMSLSGNAQLIGSDVTIMMSSGSLSLSGNGVVNLSPPSSGSYSSVVIAQPSSNTNVMSLSGNGNMNITGAIYSPNGTINMSGNGVVQGEGPLIGDIVIARVVNMSGNSTIKVGRPHLQAVAPPKIPLAD